MHSTSILLIYALSHLCKETVYFANRQSRMKYLGLSVQYDEKKKKKPSNPNTRAIHIHKTNSCVSLKIIRYPVSHWHVALKIIARVFSRNYRKAEILLLN